MTDLIVRTVELITGALLIVVTLLFSAYYPGQTMLLLLPLIALPIIFLGMFDWHPAKELGLLLANAGKRFSLAELIKPPVNIH